MPTYVEILNSQIDQDSPVIQPLLTAMRDNPIAMAEGDSTAIVVGGTLSWVERQEPTSDVAAITFTTSLTGESASAAVVDVIGQWAGGSGGYWTVGVRASGGTWRTIGRTGVLATNPGAIYVRWMVENIDNLDGSNVVRSTATGWYAGTSTAFDRSSAANAYGVTASIVSGGGYSSFAETIDEIRVSSVTSTYEGSNADQRTIATLGVITHPTRSV